MSKLLTYLKRTQAPEVWVCMAQVESEIGAEKAQELALVNCMLQEGKRPDGRLITEQLKNMKIIRSNNITCFDRKLLVKALEGKGTVQQSLFIPNQAPPTSPPENQGGGL